MSSGLFRHRSARTATRPSRSTKGWRKSAVTTPPAESSAGFSGIVAMTAEAGVNPNTMQRTLAAMEDEGLLTSQRNTGRYVTQDTALLHAKRDALAQKELALFREKMKLLCYTEQEIKELLSKEDTHE